MTSNFLETNKLCLKKEGQGQKKQLLLQNKLKGPFQGTKMMLEIDSFVRFWAENQTNELDKRLKKDYKIANVTKCFSGLIQVG